MLERSHWARLIDPELLYLVLRLAKLDPELGAACALVLERRYPLPPREGMEDCWGDAGAWE